MYDVKMTQHMITPEVKISTWTIRFKIKDQIIINNYSSLINHFINFSDNIRTNYLLNFTNNNFSFIEKLIYDNVFFHMKRLNIPNFDNKIVSFWTKKTEYNFKYIHMHIDHCDYESRVYDTELKKPLFTSIIYLDDNSCPTLITEITSDMSNDNNFEKNNNKLTFSFPKVLKNVVFDSGKYFHGESYLSEYKITQRKTIVIAVWGENDKPLFVPYFDKSFFYYYLFVKYERIIETNEHDEFNKVDNLIEMESRDNIITIPINDNLLINEDFFNKLIIKKEKNVLYRFENIINKIKEPDTIVLDFSKMFNLKLNCDLDFFKITPNIEVNDLNNELLVLTKEFLLNTNKTTFDIVEKYIYDISEFHIHSLKLSVDDVYVTFKVILQPDNAFIKNEFGNSPLFSVISFLQNNINPILLSDIDSDSYKYKKNKNKKICAIIPTLKCQIAFSGEHFYNYNSNKLLVINIWKKDTILKTKQYDGKNNIYLKNDIVTFIEKQTLLQKKISINDNELFEKILYKTEIKEILTKLLTNENVKENILFFLIL